MRTLLDESIPPHLPREESISAPGQEAKNTRTFPESAVLAPLTNLLEVGVDGTAMATPKESGAEGANTTFERGLADSAPCQASFGDGKCDDSKAEEPNQPAPLS